MLYTIMYHGGYKHLLQMRCWLVGTKEIGSGKKEIRVERRKDGFTPNLD